MELVENPDLTAIQEIIDRSTKTASPAVAGSIAFPSRQMSAAELAEFWRNNRLIAMSTVGPNGAPHIAPVHARIVGAQIRLVVYDNTIRRTDLATNPRVAFSAWNAEGAAVIVYGRAREIPNSLRDARAGQDGTPRKVVELEVTITRIYAMRAR
ncbi:MAG TPA: pyridoxamine 5'-phosphate oxidase family protein [Candidatus Binataceae bacterium]|nr:pyridoxamine 5'-phosphate oxidase family protein [Candidatus Binataceae bacterium]